MNAASGGTVTLANGLSIKLPVGGIVNAATNATYTGTVNVAAYWINPTAADLNQIMPGDLRGINTEGTLKLLQTFGMAAVELTGASGELLQIANGQKQHLLYPYHLLFRLRHQPPFLYGILMKSMVYGSRKAVQQKPAIPMWVM
ncbi:MAG: hypothetical protein IPP81_11130 [Chitinophagaceae bacterium]|nr:hypothetical protein [Chitinophagaceae bacterium]